MTGVIYADVLFILNTYINYAILTLTALFLHVTPSRLRLLCGAVLGGACSLIILFPWAGDGVLGVLRLVLCFGLPLIAFSYGGIKQTVKLSVVFLSVNFLFAGIMFALWYFVSPTAVYYNTGIFYFDMDAMGLVVITALCYFAVKIFSFVTQLKAPKNTIYDVYLEISGDVVYLKGFLDTGNNLRDPFTGSDVIIVSRNALEKHFPKEKEMSEIIESSPLKIRYLPCVTVSGNSLLPIFRCDKVRIKGINCDFSVASALIGVSEEKIKNGDFQALLPAGIFQNKYSDKGADHEETKRFFVKTDI